MRSSCDLLRAPVIEEDGLLPPAAYKAGAWLDGRRPDVSLP
jgi:hypothetical protein